MDFLALTYQFELENKDTTESIIPASYLNCYLCIDNGKLVTNLYDKLSDFNFPLVIFPFLRSNIPSAPTYGVYSLNLSVMLEPVKISRHKAIAEQSLCQQLKKLYGRHGSFDP